MYEILVYLIRLHESNAVEIMLSDLCRGGVSAVLVGFFGWCFVVFLKLFLFYWKAELTFLIVSRTGEAEITGTVNH